MRRSFLGHRIKVLGILMSQFRESTDNKITGPLVHRDRSDVTGSREVDMMDNWTDIRTHVLREIVVWACLARALLHSCPQGFAR